MVELDVFLTAYDPSDLPGASIDPIGFERGYLFLADKLLPALTNVAAVPRYFSMLCAGTSLSAVDPSAPPRKLREARRDSAMRLERLWALANYLAAQASGRPLGGLRGVSYVARESARLTGAGATEADPDYKLLSRQAPYGALGIYGAVAEELRLFADRDMMELSPDAGLPLAEAFCRETKLPSKVEKAVISGASVSLSTLAKWGESAHLSGPHGAEEAAQLRDALVRDPVRARMCDLLAKHPFRDGETELARLRAIASSVARTGPDADLRETIEVIIAYENAYAWLLVGFERLLGLCREATTHVGDATRASDPVLAQVSAAVPGVAAALEATLARASTPHLGANPEPLLDVREFLKRAAATSSDVLAMSRKQQCLGGAGAVKTLKGRITRRDGDLVGLGLDRVLWSMHWASARMAEAPFDVAELALTDDDLSIIAESALRCGIDILEEHPDRVFLHRAVEHALAVRLSCHPNVAAEWKQALEAIANRSWVSHSYGLNGHPVDHEDGQTATDAIDPIDAAIDERGVHAVYDERVPRPAPELVAQLSAQLVERRARLKSQDRLAIFDGYEHAPSLWFGRSPSQLTNDPHHEQAIRRLHQRLRELTFTEGKLDWASRRSTFQALRRAMLRDSLLVRLLPERSERDEAAWGELLAEQFHTPQPGQAESIADRFAAFVEDLAAASGRIGVAGDARDALYDATRLRDSSFVALATGDTDPQSRNRSFTGFNTPLLPEVLICTSVGQEGIDLHRHCRQVVHYDLAWNPAVLEQRTGRTDRIGSMTFRERQGAGEHDGPFLEVGVPFLAGTYDERMFEELRLRAQTFEVLTGGELSADNPDGNDEQPEAEGAAQGLQLLPLPEEMLAELRVRLHVWPDAR